jgi:hypothetical protein
MIPGLEYEVYALLLKGGKCGYKKSLYMCPEDGQIYIHGFSRHCLLVIQEPILVLGRIAVSSTSLDDSINSLMTSLVMSER